MHDRTLDWEGCLNVRDLGGFATEDGGETRWGSVIRADSVRALTDTGWEALARHGVATVVDLRSHDELAGDPPRALDLDVVHVPVVGEPDDPAWPEIRAGARAAATEDGEDKSAFYLQIVRRWSEGFAAAIAATAVARPGGVVIHCHSGKDRTGLVVAFLLRLAAVPAEAVAQDYALSAGNLVVPMGAWIDEADDDDERSRRQRMAASPAGAMRRVLEALEDEHGSVAGFLRAAGLDEPTVDAARARLRA